MAMPMEANARDVRSQARKVRSVIHRGGVSYRLRDRVVEQRPMVRLAERARIGRDTEVKKVRMLKH